MTKPLTTMIVDDLTWYSEDDWNTLVADNARLEAKLAWAVEALKVFADDANWHGKVFKNGVTMNPTWRGPTFTPEEFARDVITVLKGGKDD